MGMKRVFPTFFAGLILLLPLGLRAQDAFFSQYYSSGLYLNPALAGTETDLTFSSNYRSQWRSIVVPYVTSQISIINPMYSKGVSERHWGGLGLSVYNDRAGDGNFKTLGLNATFAYNIPFSPNERGSNLIMGVQGGFIQKNIDYTNLQWGEQYNPFVGFDVSVTPSENQLGNRAFYPDISAGFLYTYNHMESYSDRKVSLWLGGSAYHINRPNESFVSDVTAELPILFKGHAGATFALSDKFLFSPNGLVMIQNDVRHYNAGAYLTYRVFDSYKPAFQEAGVLVGAWYRLEDSFIFTVGMTAKNYTIGFSYDWNRSNLRSFTQGRGAYEISLTIRKPKTIKRVKIETPRA